jgi:hypothetical protein
LFWLDRDRKVPGSGALWIPVIWVVLATKPIGMWLQLSNASDQNVEGDPIERIIYLVVLAVGLIVLAMRKQKVVSFLGNNLPIVLYFSYCAASVIWSDFPDVTLKRWIKGIGDLVMVMIVLTDPGRIKATLRFLAWLGFLLLPTSILLIRYYPQWGRKFSAIDGTPQIIGVATDKNMLGAVCLLFGLAAIWRVVEAFRDTRQSRLERRRALLAHCTIVAMTAYLLSIANSMTSLACFGLGTVLIVVLSLRFVTRQEWMKHALVLGLIMAVSFALFFDSGGGMVKSLGRDPTLTDRTIVWKEVLDIAGDTLIGSGYESFWTGWRLDKMWAIHWWHPNEAHNGYIEVYLNLGWIGIVLLFFVIVTGYRNVLIAFRRDQRIGKLRLAYFVVGIIYALTEAAFRTLSPVWFCFLLTTLAVPKAPASMIAKSKDVIARHPAEVQKEPEVWASPPASAEWTLKSFT